MYSQSFFKSYGVYLELESTPLTTHCNTQQLADLLHEDSFLSNPHSSFNTYYEHSTHSKLPRRKAYSQSLPLAQRNNLNGNHDPKSDVTSRATNQEEQLFNPDPSSLHADPTPRDKLSCLQDRKHSNSSVLQDL